jgi:hypothetical protein
MECQVIIGRAGRFLWLPFEAAILHGAQVAIRKREVESTFDKFSEI